MPVLGGERADDGLPAGIGEHDRDLVGPGRHGRRGHGDMSFGELDTPGGLDLAGQMPVEHGPRAHRRGHGAQQASLQGAWSSAPQRVLPPAAAALAGSVR